MYAFLTGNIFAIFLYIIFLFFLFLVYVYIYAHIVVMAHLHQFHKNQSPGLFASISSKIKSTAEILGAVKTIFEVGKGIASTVGPAAAAVAALA